MHRFRRGDLVVHSIMNDTGMILEVLSQGLDEPAIYRVLWKGMNDTIEVASDLVSWKQHRKNINERSKK